MSGFADVLRSACRARLETLARRALDGRLDRLDPARLAGMIRDAAPALTGRPDRTVLARFAALCADIAALDNASKRPPGADPPSGDSAVRRVEAALDALTALPPEPASREERTP